MKHTYHIGMRAVLWVMLGVACLASSPAMGDGRDMGCSPTLANPCTGGSSGGSSGGGYSGPTLWDLFRKSGPSAAEQADQQALAANEQGVQAYKKGDWATAISLFQQALQNNPDNPTYRQNLANARERMAEQTRAADRQRQQEEAERQRQQAEAERIERERQAEIKRQKEAAFVLDRDAAANSLMGSSGSAMGQLKGLAGAGNDGLMGGGFDSGSELKELRGSDPIDQKANLQPAPHTDTSVVDARNVPSGLPKSVDDAIPHTPSGDRVRKGFQAIQAGDWKVALAWFQDARNKEPGNPGLGRLVDLAKFTLEYRARAPEAEKNSAPVQPTQLPNQNSIPSSKDGAAIKPGAVEPGDNYIARVAATQMAARARADAAYKQYVKKYGDRDVVGRASAVAKASRGEGYTDEELKAQLQKSLLEYRKNYRKNHPNGPDDSVGGNPAAEEISIGRKG